MTRKGNQTVGPIEVLRVNQWLPEWDKVRFDPDARQSREDRSEMASKSPMTT